MLTSSNPSNQYLRPDYLSPLPTTLDAKNSPLALLAQTCSAIGADTPNPKLLANIEKSTKNHKSAECRDKSSPVSSQSSSSLSSSSMDNHLQQLPQQKSSFKPYESNNTRDRGNLTPEDRSPSTHGVRIKTPKNLNLHHQQQQQQQQQQSQLLVASTMSTSSMNGRCDSNQSATSQRDSPAAATIVSRKTPLSSLHQEQQLHQQQQNASPHRASSKESGGTVISAPQESPISRLSADNLKDGNISNSSKNVPTSLSIPTSTSSAYFQGYPTGLPYPMDLMTASALMSPHHPMFKAAALSPYLNYARMKGADPTGMMSPVCRDPYCTGCPMSPHVINKSNGQPCPAGCTQCDHASSKSYQSHSSAAAAYAHAQLAALAAASQLPYVCSWIAGDAAYCGKRFGTSDELFQHLRTHTASMPDSMLQAAAAGIPPTHPLFQRTYPTPPLSPLSTARYHPYGKPSMLPPSLAPPSLAGLQMPPHPSLAQYFSPYSLYGPRLGTPPSMHP